MKNIQISYQKLDKNKYWQDCNMRSSKAHVYLSFWLRFFVQVFSIDASSYLINLKQEETQISAWQYY